MSSPVQEEDISSGSEHGDVDSSDEEMDMNLDEVISATAALEIDDGQITSISTSTLVDPPRKSTSRSSQSSVPTPKLVPDLPPPPPGM